MGSVENPQKVLQKYVSYPYWRYDSFLHKLNLDTINKNSVDRSLIILTLQALSNIYWLFIQGTISDSNNRDVVVDSKLKEFDDFFKFD